MSDTELLRIYPNDNLSFNIDNLSQENANEFAEFDVVLKKEGTPIWEDSFQLDIEPGRNYWYFLDPGMELENGEYVYTLTGKASKTHNELKKGAVLGKAQKIIDVNDKPVNEEPKEVKPLTFEEKDGEISFSGEGFSMQFSKGLGGLVSLKYDGEEYLTSKPTISYWRPLTDTDFRIGLQFINGLWLGATIGQQLMHEKFWFEKVGETYKLTFVYRYPLPGGQESAVIYTVHPDGTLNVESTYSGLATIDTLPTFAMNFKLNKDLDAFKYYGYGPEENYIDTTEGLDLDVYESTVRKNFKKNERPQETGNRTGVRWAEVYNSKTGKGIRFTSNTDVFEFNALPYNDLEIEAAQTPAELPRVSTTNVRIAAKVTGVGNGESLPEWAKIDAGEMLELNFSISPVEVEVKKEEEKKETKTEESKAQEQASESKAEEVPKPAQPKVEEVKPEPKETKAEAPAKPAKPKTEAKPQKEEPKKPAAAKEPKEVEAKKPEEPKAKKSAPKKVKDAKSAGRNPAKKTAAQKADEKKPKRSASKRNGADPVKTEKK